MIRELNDEYEKLKQNQYIKYIVSRQKTGKDNINLKKNQIQNEIEEVSNGLNLVFEQVENIQKKIKWIQSEEKTSLIWFKDDDVDNDLKSFFEWGCHCFSSG